nr:immunoglobulin light chain junction region [Macaca mulatta]
DYYCLLYYSGAGVF